MVLGLGDPSRECLLSNSLSLCKPKKFKARNITVSVSNAFEIDVGQQILLLKNHVNASVHAQLTP